MKIAQTTPDLPVQRVLNLYLHEDFRVGIFYLQPVPGVDSLHSYYSHALILLQCTSRDLSIAGASGNALSLTL